MLNEIGTIDKIPEFIEGVKNRLRFLKYIFFDSKYLGYIAYAICPLHPCSYRKQKMSGFGHRVYKNYDPRAKVIKNLAEEVFSIVGRDPLIEVGLSFSFTDLFLHYDIYCL